MGPRIHSGGRRRQEAIIRTYGTGKATRVTVLYAILALTACSVTSADLHVDAVDASDVAQGDGAGDAHDVAAGFDGAGKDGPGDAGGTDASGGDAAPDERSDADEPRDAARDQATDAGPDDVGATDERADADSVPDVGADTIPEWDAATDVPTELYSGPDLDHDGLADAYEAFLAEKYLPILALHPDDKCTLGGIVYRLRPHPQNPNLIHVVYDHLYQTDCGLTGHVGDDEVFSMTVNPAKPASEGVTYLKAISHQATLCQKITECGACNQAAACDTGDDAGVARPVVYASKDKHGTYVSLTGCNQWTCFDQCATAPPRRCCW